MIITITGAAENIPGAIWQNLFTRSVSLQATPTARNRDARGVAGRGIKKFPIQADDGGMGIVEDPKWALNPTPIQSEFWGVPFGIDC